MSDCNWTVYVDDNFHYRNEDERYSLGAFDSYDAAVVACKKIVDDFLQGSSAKTDAELYDQYTSFGSDPWIKGPAPAPGTKPFSAWDYARQRCAELRP